MMVEMMDSEEMAVVVVAVMRGVVVVMVNDGAGWPIFHAAWHRWVRSEGCLQTVPSVAFPAWITWRVHNSRRPLTRYVESVCEVFGAEVRGKASEGTSFMIV